MKRSQFAAGAALFAVTAGTLTGISMSAAPDAAPIPDTRPAQPPVIRKSATGPRGQLAIATYRNARGQDCFATGRVRDSRIGAVDREGRFHPLPPEGGNCKQVGAPFGFQIEPIDGGGTLVSGVADGDVVRVELKADGVSAEGTPSADDGAFTFFSAEQPRRNVRLRFVYADGRMVETPSYTEPDWGTLAEIQRDAARAAGLSPAEAQERYGTDQLP